MKYKTDLRYFKILVAGLEPLVVTLEDPQCLNKSLTGNLGSSLAKLNRLKDDIPLVIVFFSN